VGVQVGDDMGCVALQEVAGGVGDEGGAAWVGGAWSSTAFHKYLSTWIESRMMSRWTPRVLWGSRTPSLGLSWTVVLLLLKVSHDRERVVAPALPRLLPDR
jgi:hypothetical protein